MNAHTGMLDRPQRQAIGRGRVAQVPGGKNQNQGAPGPAFGTWETEFSGSRALI